MRAEVRDDIISLETFVQARFKFEKYLIPIRNSGSYCFLDQFKRNYSNGEYIAKCMEESNLIRCENFNNAYKYIYLTDTAVKYLTLKNSDKDYSNMDKNMISIQQITRYPTEKVLLNSAIKYQLLFNPENNYIIKGNLINELEIEYLKKFELFDLDTRIIEAEGVINKIKESFNRSKIYYDIATTALKGIQEEEYWDKSEGLPKQLNEKNIEIENLNKVLLGLGLLDKNKKNEIRKQIEVIKEATQRLTFNINLQKKISEQKQFLKVPLDELNSNYKISFKALQHLKKIKTDNQDKYDKMIIFKNKILNLYDKSKIIVRLKAGNLNYEIIDTGNFKSAYGYLKQINSLKLEEYSINSVNIVIFSYSEKRANNMKNEFEVTQKERIKADETMKEYETFMGISRSTRSKWQKTPPHSYFVAEKIYYNTPVINEIILNAETWYMAVYKKNAVIKKIYIKAKDKNTIEGLGKKLVPMQGDSKEQY